MTKSDVEQIKQHFFESCFVVEDTNLYLDTHPGDTEALLFFQNAIRELRNARQIYEKVIGPLTYDSSMSDSYHEWINNPWPWEGGAN